MIPLLPPWLMALLPNLAGGLISAKLSQDQINKMNFYNNPVNQMRRANEAGLPFAALSGMSASQQSSIPDVSGIGNSISGWNSSYQQLKQIELLQEQIRNADASADIRENERDISNEEWQAGVYEGQIEDGITISNARLAKRNSYKAQKIALDIAENQKEISDIDVRISSALEQNKLDVAKAELDALFLKLDLGRQAFDNIHAANVAKNTIIKRMEKGGLSLMEALLIQVMSALSGGIGFGGKDGTKGQFGF